MTNGAAEPGGRAGRRPAAVRTISAAAAASDSRRIERPQRRAGARQADRPAQEPAQGAPERHERRDDERGRRQQVVGRRPARRPARRGRPRSAPSRAPRRGASDDIRTEPSPWRPDRVEGGEDVGRRDGDGRRDEQRRPGAPCRPLSGATRSPRPSTSAGPPARKNGTSEPDGAATAVTVVVVELGAPRLERAVERRRGVRRPAGRDRRRPGSACRGGRRAPAPARAARPSRTDRGPDGGERLAGRGCPPAVRRRAPLDVERVAVATAASARLSRSARASGTKTEWRSWKPSSRRPTTARVRLSLAGASRTTGERRRRGSCTAVIGSRAPRRPRPSGPIGPSASWSASHSPTASVCGRRSGSIPAVASAAVTRPASSGSWRASTLWIILRRSRKPPGPAATARPRSPDRAGRRRHTARGR